MAPAMPRVRSALLASLLVLGGCKDEPGAATGRGSGPTIGSPAAADDPVAEPDARSVAAAEDGTRSYARTLAQQLDLVPPDADAYLVVRDLRPLVEQARRVEQVLAGPLTRAIPALAGLGGGTGAARVAELGQVRERLALVLAGLESSGVALDQGAVLVAGGGAPLVLFAAEDLDRLAALAGMLGAEAALASRCAGVADAPGWVACSLAEVPAAGEALARYRPARQGAALRERLAASLGLAGPVGSVELDAINVAMSLGSTDGSLDAALRTDPGVWELTIPVPLPPGDALLGTGAAPALAAWVPGTSFVWARVDPTLLGLGVVEARLLTGELWLGVVDEPDGLVAELGVREASAVAERLQALVAELPESALEPAALDGARIELDRASIEIGGRRVPSLGATLVGDAASSWAATLGVPARARIWAEGDYLSAAVGEVQAIPAALSSRRGAGPAADALAGLPATLAQALAAGEVALIVHLDLDPWQAPPREAELTSLWAGLGGDGPADAAALAKATAAVFQVLAPWSSVDLWVRRRDRQWIAQVSLVPFAGGGVGADERAAAEAVLDAVLAGADGAPGYRELLARYPGSAAASSYRARAGLAADHHAVVGMIEVGLVAAVVVPALRGYVDQAKTREAGAETQAILSAALGVYERTGSCAAILGEAGPTPPLAVQCHAGDGGRCRPVAEPSDAPGEYPRALWTDDPLWSALDYRPNRRGTGSHRYHYSFTAKQDKDRCRVEARAIGDLDGDGELATYTRSATIAADGSQAVAAMEVVSGDE